MVFGYFLEDLRVNLHSDILLPPFGKSSEGEIRWVKKRFQAAPNAWHGRRMLDNYLEDGIPGRKMLSG